MPKTTTLTAKEIAFVQHRVSGMGGAQSAVAAGYARASASVTAAKLSKKRTIIEAIKAGKEKAGMQAMLGVAPDKNVMQRDHYADPMDFLTDLMNHPAMPVAMRKDAAKDLMPYKHARIGEKGKKESKGDAARTAAGGKFKPKDAPGNVVPMRAAG